MAGITTRNLAQAKDAAGSLLEQIGLQTYVFEVEPHETGDWHLRIDCAADDGWRSLVIPINVERLLASSANSLIRTEILHDWTNAIADGHTTTRSN